MTKDETKTSVLSCLSPTSWLGFVTSVLVPNPGIRVADALLPLCSDLSYGNWPCSPSAFAKCFMANLLYKFLHLLFIVSPFVMACKVCVTVLRRGLLSNVVLWLCPSQKGHSILLHATLQELGSCVSSRTRWKESVGRKS